MIQKHPLKVTFLKKDSMIFFSQLDIFRFFIRALHRAKLPIFYTSGFNPHPKISFSHALKVGKEGELQATFYFTESITLEIFRKDFGAQLPPGLLIKSIEQPDAR